MEKRKAARIDKPVEVKFRFAGQLLRVGVQSINISTQGVRLPLFQRLTLGMTLELEIVLSGLARPLKALGEVIWVRQRDDRQSPFEAGIKFAKISAIDLEVIKNFCQSHNRALPG